MDNNVVNAKEMNQEHILIFNISNEPSQQNVENILSRKL